VDIIKKHKEGLEYEKDFWLNIVHQGKFRAMQDNWRKAANYLEHITKQYITLDSTSKILQIGVAVQDSINFWKIGKRFTVDPLAVFYRKSFSICDKDLFSIAGLGESLPFLKASVDVILCLNVLDHTRDPKRVISECKRIMRSGGIFFLGVNVYPEDLIDKENDDPIHFWRFTSSDILELLKNNDFIIKDSTLHEGSDMQNTKWFWLAAIKP